MSSSQKWLLDGNKKLYNIHFPNLSKQAFYSREGLDLKLPEDWKWGDIKQLSFQCLFYPNSNETVISLCISCNCAMQFSSHKMTTLNLYKFTVPFHLLPYSVKTLVLLTMILNKIDTFARTKKSKKDALKNNQLWKADNVVLVQKYVIPVTNTVFTFIRSSFCVGLSPIQMSLGILLFKPEKDQHQLYLNDTSLIHSYIFDNYIFVLIGQACL